MWRQAVSPDAAVADDLRLFATAIRDGTLVPVDRLIETRYEAKRPELFHPAGWTKPIAMLLFAFGVAYDAIYDITEDLETLDRKQRHVAYWWDKTPVKRTRAAHQRAVEWKEKWIGEHRYDSYPGL